MYVLTCQMKAPSPIAETFAVFESPYNLARITPTSLKFRITTKERVTIRKGAEIEYQLRWLGLPISWRTIFTEYEPPLFFEDEQAEGPYALWRHRHSFEEVEDARSSPIVWNTRCRSERWGDWLNSSLWGANCEESSNTASAL